jgi:inorganic phosphate transporter, PiT family
VLLMTLAILTIVAAATLAFANGANDVSKGVATLAGTGRASYRAALAWGTVWTFAGGLASLVISLGLVRAFTSAIVTADVLATPTFALAVAIGAAAWVLFASRTGLPVSTTHALTGAIVGVALAVGGAASVHWPMLIATIAAPLALSPLAAGLIGYGMHAMTARTSPACICVESEMRIVGVDEGGAAVAFRAPHLVATTQGCDAGENRWRLMPAGAIHWGAAGALSFARGVNDNAKLAGIAALGLTTLSTNIWLAFATTAVAMTIGSYAAGLRVTRTLGERVVHMEQDTGLAAALVAAALVLAASFYTVPVSTTHVSTGAIVGAGVRQGAGAVEWHRLGSIGAAWIITLPVAALLAALAVTVVGLFT